MPYISAGGQKSILLLLANMMGDMTRMGFTDIKYIEDERGFTEIHATYGPVRHHITYGKADEPGYYTPHHRVMEIKDGT